MSKQKIYLSVIATLIFSISLAQKSVNQYNKDGQRHGLWTKNYHKTNQKRYEGVFNHGKEIDSFKYYTLSTGKSVLSAVKIFNEKDSLAKVTFFASNKKIISQGQMNGKKFIGKWIYFHKNSTAKMIVENFNDDGLLEGERFVFYKNGLVAEKAFYKNGKLNGESKWFSEKNILLRYTNYKDNLHHGKSINYDSEGNVTTEGNYIEDQKKGIWLYYKAGILTRKIDYTNQKVIWKKQ
ncbi:toxin-antitoxin system YwqK family antitoxin [uncultured Winogradskyella sp.]|uniref:toxin-antitoxin system YwqK family antitoxin n=1 Tax=uncultured Winogradskyella sp. TaxID=395353 RepID=UPI0030DA601F|tara:strand:+ start:12348 stop:13058 length:711 start_codon:yes stop_codon:yes gene_type:complete